MCVCHNYMDDIGSIYEDRSQCYIINFGQIKIILKVHILSIYDLRQSPRVTSECTNFFKFLYQIVQHVYDYLTCHGLQTSKLMFIYIVFFILFRISAVNAINYYNNIRRIAEDLKYYIHRRNGIPDPKVLVWPGLLGTSNDPSNL